MTYRVEDGVLIITSEDSEDNFEEMPAEGAAGEREIAIGRAGMGMMGGMGGGMGGMGGGGRGLAPRPAAPVVARAQAKDEATPAGRAEDIKKKEPAKPDAAPADARAAFVETAYWNPSVVTDATGRARVTFRAPSALAEYRLAALGVTGSDTLVGQSTSGISVRKAFFVELKAPNVLTEGDEPQLLARLHHPGIKGQARVALKVDAGGREEVYPKTVDLAAGGVTEVLLDAFRVPGVDRVKLTVSTSAGEEAARVGDEVAAEVPVRAWGLPVYATASGRSSDDATVFVALPQGRRYENPEMRIALSPRADRMLVELALDESGAGFGLRPDLGCVPAGTTLDRAGDLLGAAAALASVRDAPGHESDDAARLTARISQRVTDLVVAQNNDGSWPWIPGATGQGSATSDLLATARVVWALTAAEPLGLGADPSVLDRSTRFLEQALPRLDAGDWTLRAAVLHALALRNRARFESVNALLRERAEIVRADSGLPGVLTDAARPRGTGRRGAGSPVRTGKDGAGGAGPSAAPILVRRRPCAGRGSAVETTALVAIAFARLRPGAADAAGARDWLLAHRVGNGWLPAEAKGLVLQALAVAPGRGAAAARIDTGLSSPSTTPRSFAPRSAGPHPPARSRSPAPRSRPGPRTAWRSTSRAGARSPML